MELISVIIPVYNSENTIEKCVMSVCEQSYKNVELIIVNDGSTDSTASICRKLIEKDDRVTIIDIENSGVSIARNIGMAQSSGRYITFLDSDDYFSTDALLLMANKIYDADLVVGNLKYTYVDKENIEKDYIFDNEGKITIASYLNYFSKYHLDVVLGSNWNKLYNKKIIDEKNIYFEKNEYFAEDLVFNLKYLEYVKQIYVMNEIINYHAVDTFDSLSKKDHNIDILWTRCKIIYNMISQLYKKNDISKSNLNDFLLNLLDLTIRRICMSSVTFYSKVKKCSIICQDAFEKIDDIQYHSDNRLYNYIIKCKNKPIILITIYIFLDVKNRRRMYE